MKKHRILSYLMLAIFAASSFLALTSLDNALFWDDEAHISLIARNYLATGQLSGWDGRNLVAYRNGTFLDANLNTINPPLDNLVAAASFKLNGINTWAGRIPFVLLGLAALALFGLLLHHKFGPAKVTALTFSLLALSPVFLLNIRTVRYNSLVILFALGAYYAYERYRTTKQPLNLAAIALCGALFFFSNYMLFAVFFASLLLLALTLHRRSFDARDWKRVGVTVAAILLAITPYAVAHRIWSYPSLATEPWWQRKLTLIWWNFRDLNFLTAMPWVIAVLLAIFLLQAHRQKRSATGAQEGNAPNASAPDASAAPQDRLITVAHEWVFLCVAYILVLCLVSPQTTNTDITNYADFRFLTPIIPFLFGLIGITVALVARRSLPAGIVLWVVLVSSNLLTITPWEARLRWLLTGYITELIYPYPTPFSETIAFLNANAAQDDTVLGWPEYNNYPLIFYVGDKYRFCCLLDETSPLPKEKIAALNAPLSVEENFPQWFISYGAFPQNREKLLHFSRPHIVNGKTMAYKYQMVKMLDTFWLQTQRPELPWHSFGPVINFDRNKHAIYVFRRGPLQEVAGVPVALPAQAAPPDPAINSLQPPQ